MAKVDREVLNKVGPDWIKAEGGLFTARTVMEMLLTLEDYYQDNFSIERARETLADLATSALTMRRALQHDAVWYRVAKAYFSRTVPQTEAEEDGETGEGEGGGEEGESAETGAEGGSR